MRILFMGTSSFAVPTLRALLKSRHEILGVVTQPDRPSGRGLQTRMSPVKQCASGLSLTIYQPETVRSEEFIATVRDLHPDAIVVVAFGQIIPKALLDIPPCGCINVHASLLPKYRGAAPIHHALFNGETTTGVTTMLMDPGLDTGPILLQREIEILPEDNQGTLESRLAELGAQLLLETLDRLERNDITPLPQDDSIATLARSVKKEDCRLDWKLDARSVVNRIRGCAPKPTAFAFWKGSELKVWSATAMDYDTANAEVGEVLRVQPEGILVKAGNGAVLLTEVQPTSKRRMSASEFARGYRVAEGERLM